jgi:hypothetical protein
MLDYFEIFTDNPLYIAIAAFGLLIVAGILYLVIRRKPKQPALPLSKKVITTGGDPIKPLLGQPGVNCIAIRNPVLLGYDKDANIVDFTTMPEPIGEIHFADTSCPISGGIYTVREREDGSIEDYDPRQVPLDIKTTPERAYQATHWPELTLVWGTPTPFYKNSSFWFAIICVVILFFIAMLAMGA